jgi:Flp pilus assembly protein TadD
MSVINRVLKDLDRKGAAPITLAGVQAVPGSADRSRPSWPWLLLLAVAAAAWWFWPGVKSPPAVPEVLEALPKLRMSDNLTAPQRPSPALGEGAVVATPAPEPGKPQRRANAPAPALGGVSKAPIVTATASDTPYPVKLDTRLPEARAPKVIKEVHPPTPHEQADQAWRAAARLLEQGRGREAQEGLEAALRLEPGHGPARQSLIALCLESGDTVRGEALLREGLQLHGNDPWYNRSLGQLTLQRGDLAQSLATLKAGLVKGADAAYWGLYAGVLGKAGRPADAAQAYREATRLNPGHGPWWIGLAVSLEQSGSRPDAAAAYQRALQTGLGPEVREFAVKKAAELAP